MDDLVLLLPRAEVFGQLPEADCTRLASLAKRRWLKAGEFLCHQDDVWPNVLFLISGRLRWALLSAGGQEHTLSFIEPDAVVWGHSVFDDQPMPAGIVATRVSDVCQWSRETVLPFLLRNPMAMWELCRLQVQAMRRAREIIYGLAFQPVAVRLARLLLERFGRQENVPAERDLTLSEIATSISCSPEAVCRVLQQFQRDGLLEISRAHITLRHREALESLIRTV